MSIFEVALESFIDMTKFRKRIGPQGAEKIFKISLMVNAEEITAKEMKMARKEDIELRRTYTRELKALKLKVRFMNHPTRMKEGKKASFPSGILLGA